MMITIEFHGDDTPQAERSLNGQSGSMTARPERRGVGTLNIVLISGSLRFASVNTAVLRAAEAQLSDAGEGGESVSVATVSGDDLPLYSEDLEDRGWPAPVEDLRALVAAADALIVSTPEYNGSMPGGLKNALDWLSRPYGAGVLGGKPVGTVSASPSAYGARWAQDHLRHVLDVSGAHLVNTEPVVIPMAFDARDEAGDIADREVLAVIAGLTDQVVAACHADRLGTGAA